MTVSVEMLSTIKPFQALASETLDRMAGVAELRTYHANTVLLQQGVPSTGLFALLSGRIKLYRRSKSKTQILAIYLPGMCFGLESLSGNMLNPWTAEAMVDTKTIFISSASLSQLFQDCSDLRVVLIQSVSDQLQGFVTLVHNLAFHDVATRLAAILIALAESGEQTTNKEPRIDRTISQKDLAAMVGTAREVIYRTFKMFEKDGLVKLTPTHIIILDKQKLSDVARREAYFPPASS